MQAQPIRIPRMLPAFAACAAIGLAVGVCRPASAPTPTYQCPPTVAHRSSAVGGWIDVPHGSYIKFREGRGCQSAGSCALHELGCDAGAECPVEKALADRLTRAGQQASPALSLS